MTSRDFVLRILADASRADSAVSKWGKGLDTTLNNAKSKFSDFAITTAGNLAAIGLDRLGQAVGDFIGGSIEESSKLSETLSASQVIFNDQAGAMEKWSKGAATAFGLSQSAALDAAVDFGNMFQQLGYGSEEAANTSQDIVALAADLGAFRNLETDEVLDMISASMRGEYDSLQRLIPNINAARVQTEALAMTGKKSAAELTAQEKAAATLAIIQGDGAAAAGYFAAEQDNAATKSKILKAQLEDQQAVLGDQLMPIWQDLQSFLMSDVIPAISGLITWIGDNSEMLTALAIAIGVVAVAVGVMNAALWLMAANPIVLLIGLIVIAVIALVAAIVWLVQNWDQVVAWITEIWSGFVGWITEVIDGFVAWWGEVWAGVSQAWSDFWGGVEQIVIDIWNGIIGWIEGGINGAIDLINGMIDGVNLVGGAFGVQIDHIGHVSLPKLATGGVTSGPMAAIIGDNPGGQEVVQPLSSLRSDRQDDIRAAVRAAVVELRGSGTGGEQLIVQQEINGLPGQSPKDIGDSAVASFAAVVGKRGS
ncbi:phage tail family protein [Microbacterium saperdae]